MEYYGKRFKYDLKPKIGYKQTCYMCLDYLTTPLSVIPNHSIITPEPDELFCQFNI